MIDDFRPVYAVRTAPSSFTLVSSAPRLHISMGFARARPRRLSLPVSLPR